MQTTGNGFYLFVVYDISPVLSKGFGGNNLVLHGAIQMLNFVLTLS